MIDTICITLDILNYGKIDIEEIGKIDILSILEEKKAEAKEKSMNNMAHKQIIQIGNQGFEILSNGSKGYAYILHNDSYEVKLAQFRSTKESFYPVFIKIKSECLWSKGVFEAWEIIKNWIIENVGQIKTVREENGQDKMLTKVNRIDLCCHTDEICLKYEDIETFAGKYQLDTIYRHRRNVASMYFGSGTTGKIMCRIYNKTLEVKQKGQKLWFFDIWKDKKLNPDKVWNVEFQISRDFLKEVKLNTVEEVFDNLKTLWQYCTKAWIEKKILDRTRIERCSTAPEWLSIQKAFDDFKGKGLIARDKQMNTSAFALIPGTIGNITSYAARAEVTDIEQLFKMIKSQGIKYLNTKEISLEEVIEQKMSLMIG